MYILDGYNLLFSLLDSDLSLRAQRQKIIHFLQRRFNALKLSGILVFDGRIHPGEESGRSYPSPLEVIYTPKGQSADAYIEERIGTLKNPRTTTLVTNDRRLVANARSLGAKIMSNAAFIDWLLSKKKKSSLPKPPISETKQNIDRLLTIFEQRLKEEDLEGQ